MKVLSSSILLLSSLLLVHQSTSQLCNDGVAASQFFTSPSPFRGVTTLMPLPEMCFTESSGLNCPYSVILGDNNPVPLEPNLDGESDTNDITKFLVWPSNTDRPYITFTFGGVRSVTALTIEFLNYPAQGISLPNLQLYTTTSLFLTDPNNQNVQPIEFDIQNNSVLSQDDYQVTNISLIFSSTSTRFLLRWDYTGVYNINFFMVSEIDFCDGTQPPGGTQITFQDPQSDNSVIIPTVEEFTVAKTTTINCTVSSSGLLEWRWRQNRSMISNNVKFNIFTADGTRTSILQLTELSVSDDAEYTCEVRRRNGEYMPKTQILSFPVIVDLPDQVTGYLDEGQVRLTCEVHGFLRSPNPPTWLDVRGSPIASTSKYRIALTDTTSPPAVLISNGSSVSGWRSTLIISQLGVGDEGTYTCMVDGNSTTAQLTVVAGTAPPVPSTTPTGGSNMTNAVVDPDTASSSTAGIIAGVVIALILLITIAIVLVLILIFFIRSREIHFSLPRPRKFSMPTRRMSLEPLRRLSIRRSVRRENLESSMNNTHQNGGGGVSTEEGTPLKRRLTKADIEWQLPHVDNNGEPAVLESELAIYSEINKPVEEKAPPVPPQNFDPQEEMPDNDQNKTNHHHYENEGFAATQVQAERRMTNSSSPKLAKMNVAESELESRDLDPNPIYEPTEDEKESKKENNGMLEPPVYAQPNFPDRRSFTPGSVASNSEPIYSEAIHPDLFSQGPEAPQESNLTPVTPLYAEPHNLTLKKIEAPIKVPAFKIKELRLLGVGQFGEVMLAETVGLSLRDLKLDKTNNKRSIRIKVAVKKLRPQAQSQVRENFDKEIKFMSKLKDDNIVRLLAVSKDDPPFIVMEYMENGDLHQFLEDYEPSYSDNILQANQLPVSILLYMAVQIASGMRYLASLRYVHRDLATRNCLVGQNFVVKISDFGMSRSLYESSYYRVKGRAMLPIRWMASESFYGRFSEKTDVWSYGVTMWEIFTLAKHQPYEEIDDQEVIQDAIRGLSRRLLEKPEFCPMEVYEVMLRCWEYAPDDRANFEEIFNTLAAIHQSL